MKIIDGWLSQTPEGVLKHTPLDIHLSPNFNVRPAEADISLIVVHNISLPPGEFGTGCVVQFFQNSLDHDVHPFFDKIRGLEVSAHCFIERTGAITQFVSFEDRAWHAGRSEFDGVTECNDYSIGIELEGTDALAYTEPQYQSLAELIKMLQDAYPAIGSDRIAGHSDVAPGRKTDPGPSFDWHKLHTLIE